MLVRIIFLELSAVRRVILITTTGNTRRAAIT